MHRCCSLIYACMYSLGEIVVFAQLCNRINPAGLHISSHYLPLALQSLSSWGGCQWVGDIFYATRGGFYGVWQPLQIGHRQAAPLPLTTSLLRLGLSLLKGEQRQALRDLIVGGEMCCKQFRLVCMLTLAKGIQEAGSLIKTCSCYNKCSQLLVWMRNVLAYHHVAQSR